MLHQFIEPAGASVIDPVCLVYCTVTALHGFPTCAHTLTLSAFQFLLDTTDKSCLLRNTKKTVCLMFTKETVKVTHSNVFLRGEELGARLYINL